MKLDRRIIFTILSIILVNISFAQQVELKKGTTIPVRLAQNINGNIDNQGDTIYFVVTEDVLVNGHVAIQKDSFAKGKITNAVGRKSLGKAGKITIEARSVKAVDGQIINVISDAMSSEGRKRTGATVAHVIMWGPIGLFAKGRAARVMLGTEYDLEIESDYTINVSDQLTNSQAIEKRNVETFFNKYKSKVNYAKGKVGKDFVLNIVMPNTSDLGRKNIQIVEILDYKLPKPIAPISIFWSNKSNTYTATFPFKEIVKYSAPGSVNVVVNIQVRTEANASSPEGQTIIFEGETTLTTKWKLK